MTKSYEFLPDWVSPPADTITDLLKEENLSLKEFTQRMSCTSHFTSKLINGSIAITPQIAEKLEIILGSSKTFWMNRESQYREHFARLQSEAKERKEWIKKFPLTDMIKFGWMSPSSDSAEKATNCLHFFGVTTVKEWHEKYNDLHKVTAFRTSSFFSSQTESIIAWLRQGEIEGQSIKCKSWNAQRFLETLLKIRPLTRMKDPQVFIPELQKRFTKCGVAVVIVPTPAKCPASGAIYFISPNKALLILSFRYLSDDHFWFSLFHEAGHLLHHGNKSLFLEGVDKSTTLEEMEANNFAA